MRSVVVAIGLGGNLGDPARAFRAALEALADDVESMRVSDLYRTEPIGGPRQPDYLNAVAVGSTLLSPTELLGRLLALEARAGRSRTGSRDEPRPLDLDLLLYGSITLAVPGLTVPHPRLAYRRFALAPLSELMPRRVVPGTGRTVARLLREAPPARVVRAGPLGPRPTIDPAAR